MTPLEPNVIYHPVRVPKNSGTCEAQENQGFYRNPAIDRFGVMMGDQGNDIGFLRW